MIDEVEIYNSSYPVEIAYNAKDKYLYIIANANQTEEEDNDYQKILYFSTILKNHS